MVLSLVLPIPVIAPVRFTGRRDLMGALANSPLTAAAASACSAVIFLLNVVLLRQTAGLPLPFGLGAA